MAFEFVHNFAPVLKSSFLLSHFTKCYQIVLGTVSTEPEDLQHKQLTKEISCTTEAENSSSY